MAHSIGIGDSGKALGMIYLEENPELIVGMLVGCIQIREINFKK